MLTSRRERDVLAQQQAERSDRGGDVSLSVAIDREQMPAVVEADVAKETAQVGTLPLVLGLC